MIIFMMNNFHVYTEFFADDLLELATAYHRLVLFAAVRKIDRTRKNGTYIRHYYYYI